jgi:hypothetical protein
VGSKTATFDWKSCRPQFYRNSVLQCFQCGILGYPHPPDITAIAGEESYMIEFQLEGRDLKRIDDFFEDSDILNGTLSNKCQREMEIVPMAEVAAYGNMLDGFLLIDQSVDRRVVEIQGDE